MAEAFIVDALRSPTGKRNGSLAHVHAADLGAHVVGAIVARNPYRRPITTTSSSAVWTRWDRKRVTLPGRPGWWQDCRYAFRERPSTGSAAARSKRCISPRRRS